MRDGLLLFDTTCNTLLAYNNVAREIWEMVDEGRPLPDIVTTIASMWTIPAEVAQRDVQSIIGLWRTQGLLDGHAAPALVQSASPAAPIVVSHAPPVGLRHPQSDRRVLGRG